MVLFASRLDEVNRTEHPVWVFDEILGRIDWSKWEAWFDLTRGQPPIHPRGAGGCGVVWFFDADSVESCFRGGVTGAARFSVAG